MSSRGSPTPAPSPEVPGRLPAVTRAWRPVGFDEVMATWAAARDPDKGSGPWTRRMLEAADTQSAGRWFDLTLRADALLDVVLPRHAGEPCHGDLRELVSAGGLRVGEAAERLRVWEPAWRRESAECWRRITVATAEPLTRVILSAAPLRDHPDYEGLPTGPGLFHLDGFHRMLGWALAGRLRDDAWVGVHLAQM